MFKLIIVILALIETSIVYAADDLNKEKSNKIDKSIIKNSTVNQAGRDIINHYAIQSKHIPTKKHKSKLEKTVNKTSKSSPTVTPIPATPSPISPTSTENTPKIPEENQITPHINVTGDQNVIGNTPKGDMTVIFNN
jgi:hypothetical protein